jgi:hypothetical protein
VNTDGPETLYQLDLLAYNSVISTDYASRILQDTAKYLLDRFCKALAHVISPNNVTNLGAGPACLQSPAAESAVDPEHMVAGVFSEAFVRALQPKHNLVQSRSKYKLVFFKPGERFDLDTMRCDNDGWSAFAPVRARKKMSGWTKQPEDGTRIKLCLFPALYSRPVRKPTRDFGTGLDVRSCLVESDNFVRDDADIGSNGFVLIVKAIVLV